MNKTAERVLEVVDSVVTLPENAKTAPQEVTFKSLGIDSLDTVEMITELEEEFDVVVPDDKINDWKNLADIIKFFEDQAA